MAEVELHKVSNNPQQCQGLENELAELVDRGGSPATQNPSADQDRMAPCVPPAVRHLIQVSAGNASTQDMLRSLVVVRGVKPSAVAVQLSDDAVDNMIEEARNDDPKLKSIATQYESVLAPHQIDRIAGATWWEAANVEIRETYARSQAARLTKQDLEVLVAGVRFSPSSQRILAIHTGR